MRIMMVIELFQMAGLCATDDERTFTNDCILRTDPPAYIAETVAIIAARILANECMLAKDVTPFIEFGMTSPGTGAPAVKRRSNFMTPSCSILYRDYFYRSAAIVLRSAQLPYHTPRYFSPR